MFDKKRTFNHLDNEPANLIEEPANSFDPLFDTDWEVFVIKRDKATGKLVGKTACCALAKVD